MKFVSRGVEAAIGGPVLKMVVQHQLKQAGLVSKTLHLLETGMPVHYYERDGTGPTLLIVHGFTDEAKNHALMVMGLKKELPNWRILIPDFIGHGKDLERVQQVGVEHFDYPTSILHLVDFIQAFLVALKVKACYAIGYSMGGAVVYWLQQLRPSLIRNAVLISPTFIATTPPQVVDDFLQGRSNVNCWESRADVKTMLRMTSCPQRKRKDPVPKFMLEAIWRDRQQHEPEGHFRKYWLLAIHQGAHDPNADQTLGTTIDVAPDLPRLVIWPREDAVASHDKGQDFFAESPNTIFHSIPDCGHLFHANGKQIMEVVPPLIADYFLNHAEHKKSNNMASMNEAENTNNSHASTTTPASSSAVSTRYGGTKEKIL